LSREPVSTSERFIELDIIRGSALAIMVFFHFWWDLNYYGMAELNTHIYWWAQIAPVLFFTLVGISLVLAARHKSREDMLLYGSLVFAMGCGISLVSQFVMPNRPVAFGVLHCIGLSMVIGAFITKVDRKYLLLLAIPLIVLGSAMSMVPVGSPNLVQLAIGVHQASPERYMVDYFPILPWFGIVVLGMVLGEVLYKDGKRQFPFPDISNHRSARAASWLGRNSLVIYLAHQPIIAGTIIYVAPIVLRYMPNI